MNKISFLSLQQYLEDEGSYIAATVKYITEILKIEIEEFKMSDLPEEWIQCIKKEATDNKLLVPDISKHSFKGFLKKD